MARENLSREPTAGFDVLSAAWMQLLSEEDLSSGFWWRRQAADAYFADIPDATGRSSFITSIQRRSSSRSPATPGRWLGCGRRQASACFFAPTGTRRWRQE